MPLTITSPAFAAGGPIPTAHTCDGANGSPPLSWAGAPERTEAFVLIVEDPDAPVGTWVHWILYDLPATTSALPADVPPVEELPRLGSARQGTNDFGRLGYGGPCPPRGPAHRYVFRLFALDTPTRLPSGTSKAVVERAMEGHMLANSELMGTYARR